MASFKKLILLSVEILVGIALLLPISALAIQAYESDVDDDRCDFL